jgi:lysozyme
MLDISPETESKLKTMLELQEGNKQFAYYDNKGNLTIGIGHNLTSAGLPPTIVDALYAADIALCKNELMAHVVEYIKLDDARKAVLLNIIFNCGLAGILGFKKMLGFISQQMYQEAAQEILNSKIAPNRAHALAQVMETGII